jgi:hypothetical protein
MKADKRAVKIEIPSFEALDSNVDISVWHEPDKDVMTIVIRSRNPKWPLYRVAEMAELPKITLDIHTFMDAIQDCIDPSYRVMRGTIIGKKKKV